MLHNISYKVAIGLLWWLPSDDDRSVCVLLVPQFRYWPRGCWVKARNIIIVYLGEGLAAQTYSICRYTMCVTLQLQLWKEEWHYLVLCMQWSLSC